ncbi:hypothetical protein [Yoonia sp. 2307UL14-13]|uniref:hypothetical protein n=1 Tax=Yoonia sp. 2307UL14-13 TaxID=3126506 RepID=UPI0030B43864
MEPGDRLNPQVLRQLIFEVVEAKFGGNYDVAAEQIKPVDRLRTKTNPFTKDALYNIVDDRTALKYSHLEAIASHYEVPTFLLLLFSRLRSEQEKANDLPLALITEVQHLLSFLKILPQEIDRGTFEAEDLERWAKRYNEMRLDLDS